jgi:hypothetical protein
MRGGPRVALPRQKSKTLSQQRIDFKQFTQHSAVVSSQNCEYMKSTGQPLCEKSLELRLCWELAIGRVLQGSWTDKILGVGRIS